jgi:hypothetical protein
VSPILADQPWLQSFKPSHSLVPRCTQSPYEVILKMDKAADRSNLLTGPRRMFAPLVDLVRPFRDSCCYRKQPFGLDGRARTFAALDRHR